MGLAFGKSLFRAKVRGVCISLVHGKKGRIICNEFRRKPQSP